MDLGERDQVVDVDAGRALDEDVVVVGVPHPAGERAAGTDGRGFDGLGDQDIVPGGAAVLVVILPMWVQLPLVPFTDLIGDRQRGDSVHERDFVGLGGGGGGEHGERESGGQQPRRRFLIMNPVIPGHPAPDRAALGWLTLLGEPVHRRNEPAPSATSGSR
ncbi:hypothetical protein [Streptomyces sp. NPDC001568]|uniref:hypothetical protein n=1 Tax=Streptomyces sp. NPDC001568 TaxID=3364588 RepID=UPI00367D3597